MPAVHFFWETVVYFLVTTIFWHAMHIQITTCLKRKIYKAVGGFTTITWFGVQLSESFLIVILILHQSNYNTIQLFRINASTCTLHEVCCLYSLFAFFLFFTNCIYSFYEIARFNTWYNLFCLQDKQAFKVS